MKKKCLVIGNNTKLGFLLKENYDVFLLCNTKQNDRSNRLSNELQSFNIIESNLVGTKKRFKRFFEIKKIIKKYDFNIVVSNRKDDMILVFLACIFKRKIRKICLFHNSYSWVNKKRAKALTKLINLCCDGNLCLSKLTYDFSKKDKKVLYLPNIIKTNDFSHKFNYAIGDIIKLCFTGVVKPEKGQKFIIDALNMVSKQFPEKKFVIDFIGDIKIEQYKQESEAIGLENNLCVNFLGRKPLEYIKENLFNYDIYISASVLEMSPYNILEAQASGLPILASNVYGHNDMIANGYNGILFELNNLNDCANQLIRLLTDDEFREKIATNALYNLKYINNFEKSAKTLFEFIERL